MERRILKKTTYTEQLSRFRELYDQGLNDKQIAGQLGIPATFVSLERTSLGLAQIVSRRVQEEKLEAVAAEKKWKETPPIVKARNTAEGPLDMAREILIADGQAVKVGDVYRLKHKTVLPFQWIEAANQVLVREGLPVIGRGGWN